MDLQPPKLQIKIAAKWKRKLANQTSILDTGCTSGMGAEHDAYCFHNTGLPSKKVFMLPDKTKIKTTNKMQLKHNLWSKASKINIVSNLHSTLISVPKMADPDYIVVFNLNEARIYNATTTIVSASKDPLIIAPRCQDTGLRKLDLDYKVLVLKSNRTTSELTPMPAKLSCFQGWLIDHQSWQAYFQGCRLLPCRLIVA
jgi:hypothetical protein